MALMDIFETARYIKKLSNDDHEVIQIISSKRNKVFKRYQTFLLVNKAGISDQIMRTCLRIPFIFSIKAKKIY